MPYRAHVTAPAPTADLAVSAPFHGALTLLVDVGDRVAAGAPVAVLEALKLESMLTAPVAGTVVEVIGSAHDLVSGGDVVATIRAAAAPTS